MKPVILEGRGLCKTYTNGEVSTHVIRNLDIDVYEGDFTVIMGSSGAGKSTLLYLLGGIESLTAGEIRLMEKRIDVLKEKDMISIRRTGIGFVFQEPNLLEDFTVFENIAMTGYLKDKNRARVNELTEKLLTEINMTGCMDRYPNQLSGGEKQRVAIARSLINQPQVVFADEPTGSLNGVHSENALTLLTDIHEKGQSILMVTHDIKAASRGNRLLYIKDGKIDGVLDLEQFMVEDQKERETQIFDFIMSRGW